MWYSTRTNGCNAWLLTADSIRGPWKKRPDNPILSDNDIRFRAGHNHRFHSFDGRDYLKKTGQLFFFSRPVCLFELICAE